MAPPKWQGFQFQSFIPGVEQLLDINEVVGPVVDFLQQISDFLNLIKSFLFEFSDPIAALVDTLLQELIALTESLRQLGVYYLELLPNFQKDPDLNQIKGGSQAFIRRIGASLTDSEDPNRPQFGTNDIMGGVVLAIEARNVGELVKTINKIQQFFGRAKAAQPASPTNLTAQPADTNGNPITASSTNYEVGGVLLEWSVPGELTPFTLPESFLIERSQMKQGLLQETEQTLDTYTNLQEEGVQKLKVPVRRLGVQFSEWEAVAKVDPGAAAISVPTQDPSTFGVANIEDPGFLGDVVLALRSEDDFSFFDSTAQQGQTYYYRVRSLYEDIEVEKIVKEGVVGGAVVSEPSTPVTAAVPFTPTKLPEGAEGQRVSFREAMGDLYRAAYVLQFYRTADELANLTPAIATPTGTESLPEIDARSLFDYLNVVFDRGIPLDAIISDVASTINGWVERFSNRAANQLMRRPPTTDLFASVYAPNRDRLRELWLLFIANISTTDIQGSVLTPDPNIPFATENDRETVLRMINLVKELGVFPGTPPNWETIRLFEDFMPIVDELLGAVSEKLRGFITGGQGVVKDVGEYIDFLNRRIAFLIEFIEDLEETLQLLVNTDFGVYFLNIIPNSGGVNYFMNALQTAESAPESSNLSAILDGEGVELPPGSANIPPGPGGGPNDYTAGLVLAYGSPSAESFSFGGTQAQFEATKAAFELLFGG